MRRGALVAAAASDTRKQPNNGDSGNLGLVIIWVDAFETPPE